MEESRQEKDMTPILIKDLGLLYDTERSKRKSRWGLYKCQYCGKEFKSRMDSIKSKRTLSCGCYNKMRTSTHLLSKHRFYNKWASMMHRCYNQKNKSYPDYGGRGITVCKEWQDVKNFIKWVEETYTEGYTLDRIDNDKAYSPNNCRWVNKTIQSINRRKLKSNKSGYVGVFWNKITNKWQSSIKVNKKSIHLGYFEDKMEAVKARDDYIKEHNLPHKLSTEY